MRRGTAEGCNSTRAGVSRGMRLLRAVPTVLAVAAALTVAAAGSAAAADPVPPVVTTGSASAIGQGTATVAGTVDPEGAATTYVVEYGTTASYGLTSTTRDAGAGADPVPVAVPLTGLTSDTTYHYRTVATNAAGTARGADRTLRTALVPRSPIVTTGAAREVTTGSAYSSPAPSTPAVCPPTCPSTTAPRRSTAPRRPSCPWTGSGAAPSTCSSPACRPSRSTPTGWWRATPRARPAGRPAR